MDPPSAGAGLQETVVRREAKQALVHGFIVFRLQHAGDIVDQFGWKNSVRLVKLPLL